MAQQLTSPAQLNGYKFLVRRLKHALVSHDVRMLHDPMRSQSRAVIVGFAIAAIIIIAALIMSILRPAPNMGNAKLVFSQEAGTMYVRMGKTFDPVLNLASARLILGSPEIPVSVHEKDLRNVPRGPLVGIVGAPSIEHSADTSHSWWTVCDKRELHTVENTVPSNVSTITVISGKPDFTGHTQPLASDQAILVGVRDTTGPGGAIYYLLYKNKRARLNISSSRIRHLLRGSDYGAVGRYVSSSLFNSFPEVAPIEPPVIRYVGHNITRYKLPNFIVGNVFAENVPNSDKRYYVALQDGIQEISAFTAYFILATSKDQAENENIQLVPPAVIERLPQVPVAERLKVDDYPPVLPTYIPLDAAHAVICVTWDRPANTRVHPSNLVVTVGGELPLNSDRVPLAFPTSLHEGATADYFYMKPASGEYVTASGLDSYSQRKDQLYYVSDTGIRCGIDSIQDASYLGFFQEPLNAPWQIIKLLPEGPMLSQQLALVIHDGIARDDGAIHTQIPDHNY